MKVIRYLKPPKEEDESLKAMVVAKRVLTHLMNDVAYPAAVEKAPGSIKGKIKVLSVRQSGNGLLVALSIPNEYRVVEEGSGIYVGQAPFVIESEKWRALNTRLGYYKHVRFVGQPGQKFLAKALELVVEQFPGAFVAEFTK